MSRTDSTAYDSDGLSPCYLVYLGFDEPIYLSSRGVIAFDGSSWSAADMRVRLGKTPSVTIFNESTALGNVVIYYGTAGRPIRIYLVLAEDNATGTDAVLVFSGEMRASSVGEVVQISAAHFPVARTPRQFASAPMFNHLPVAGTVIKTPSQVITLERK